jgi:hypothetical protein
MFTIIGTTLLVLIFVYTLIDKHRSQTKNVLGRITKEKILKGANILSPIVIEKNCRNCGANIVTNKNGEHVCCYCGTAVNEPKKKALIPVTKSGDKINWLWIGGACAMGVLVVGALPYMYYNQYKNKSKLT